MKRENKWIVSLTNLKRFSLSLLFFGWTAFSYAQTYQVNGNAVNHGGGLVRLTTSSVGAWQTASAWSTTKHDLTQPFDMSFDMFFGCENGPDGGDGITFTFQNQGLNAIGGGGGFLGVGGGPIVTPSISIEFDTYDGTASGGTNEIPQDHIAIDINGDVNNTGNFFMGTSGLTTVQPVLGGRDLEDCAVNANNYYTIRVVWDPVAHTLQLYEEGVLTMTYTNDIVANIFGGNPSVYWGFTGSTGSASNEQWIAPAGSIIPWSCAVNSCCAPFTVTPTGPTMVCSTPITLGAADPYTSYSWSTGQTSPTINISAPGTYSLSVIQTQGGQMCPGTATFVIGTSGPTATLSGDATICNDGTTTPLSVDLTGAGPWTLTYAIDGDPQTAVSGIATSPYIINGTAPHTYSLVSVVDNGGCNGLATGTAQVDAHAGLPVGHDNTFVAPGSTTLNVDNGGGVYEWYDAPTGGTLVQTGTLYNTPVLSATTTYYVQNTSLPAFSSKSVALLNTSDPVAGGSPGPTALGLPKGDNWLDFTANSSFTLTRITCAVNVTAATWVTSRVSLTIHDYTGGTTVTIDSTVTAPMTPGVQNFYLSFNYPVVAGHSYRISYEGQNSMGGLGGNIQAIMYWNLVTITPTPYHITNHPEVDITQNSPQTQRYPGMFDWRITVGSQASTCGRTPVTAYATVPAPVTLIDFTAVYVKPKTVALTWSTASEINNQYFTVQRSTDGINFTDILVVAGAGTSNRINVYEEFDNNAPAGISYYRLKQTDFDGTYTYSGIVKVFSEGQELSFQLLPNISTAGSEVRVVITGAEADQRIPVELYDLLGRKVYSTAYISDAAGNVSELLNVSGASLTSGTYIAVAFPASGKEFKQKIVFMN